MYNESNGQIIFHDEEINHVGCAFTINSNQPNSTISVYLSHFIERSNESIIVMVIQHDLLYTLQLIT